MYLYGEKVILRAIEERDCEIMRQMINDPEIEHFIVGWAFPVSEYAQKQWYQNHSSDNLMNSGVLRLIIADKNDDTALGQISLSEFSWRDRSAQTGIKIHSKSDRAKGIGTDAMYTLMRYAFDELGLNRLEARYYDYNASSAALHKKVGFKNEGVLRQASYKNGKYHDVCVTSILADEYREMMSKKENGEG